MFHGRNACVATGPEPVGVFLGHSRNVSALTWSDFGTQLMSGGVDGACYEWALKDVARVR